MSVVLLLLVRTGSKAKPGRRYVDFGRNCDSCGRDISSPLQEEELQVFHTLTPDAPCIQFITVKWKPWNFVGRTSVRLAITEAVASSTGNTTFQWQNSFLYHINDGNGWCGLIVNSKMQIHYYSWTNLRRYWRENYWLETVESWFPSGCTSTGIW